MFPNTKYLRVFLLLVDNIRKGAGHLEVSRPEYFYQTFQQQQIFLHNTFLAMKKIQIILLRPVAERKARVWRVNATPYHMVSVPGEINIITRMALMVMIMIARVNIKL